MHPGAGHNLSWHWQTPVVVTQAQLTLQLGVVQVVNSGTQTPSTHLDLSHKLDLLAIQSIGSSSHFPVDASHKFGWHLSPDDGHTTGENTNGNVKLVEVESQRTVKQLAGVGSAFGVE